MIKPKIAACGAVLSLLATCAAADSDAQQAVAQANIQRLHDLLDCAAAADPDHVSFAVGIDTEAASHVFVFPLTPRVIRAMVSQGPLPGLQSGDTWQLMFEFTETGVFVIDETEEVDRTTMQFVPNPLPEFPAAPEFTQRAMAAFETCGVVWLGDWDYAPVPTFGDIDPDSLLPPG